MHGTCLGISTLSFGINYKSPHIAWRNLRNLTCVPTVVVHSTLTQTTLKQGGERQKGVPRSAGARPPSGRRDADVLRPM